MSDAERLRMRDEVLQIMYWMLGEGIAHEVDAAYVARFLSVPEDGVAAALAGLADRRLVLRGGRRGCYRLTEDGMRDGATRFHDEFRDLTRLAHGQCAPGCWCHTPQGEGRDCPTRGRSAA